MSVHPRRRSTRLIGMLVSAVLGASAALLASCGSTARLIPVANSEPLQRDFEEVARAAEGGHGSCAATEAALAKTEHDYSSLPSSIDAGLKRRLHEGIEKLRSDALELCVQPSVQTTSTTTAPRATTATTPTTTTTTNTQTTTTTPTTPTTHTTTTAPGGGTPAGEGEHESEEAREGKHAGKSPGGEGGPAGGAPPGAEGGQR